MNKTILVKRGSNSKPSQTARILKMLQAGPKTNAELIKVSYRYGARIYELRREGHNILRERMKEGLYRYTLMQEAK